MRTRLIAILEVVLISPAAVFMTELFVRFLQPVGYEPARSAQQLVMWYAARMWTLWVLLLALPFAALVTGCVWLLRCWNREPQRPHAVRKSLAMLRSNLAALFISLTTVAAGVILAIVVLHMAAN